MHAQFEKASKKPRLRTEKWLFLYSNNTGDVRILDIAKLYLAA
jgi:hypothetical protein